MDLPHASTDGQHLGHSADALQPASDRPVSQRAEIHGCHLTVRAFQTDEHDLTHQRGHWRHAWRHSFRQGAEHRLHALLHQLTGAVDVRAPAKFHEDEGQAHVGIRSHAIQATHALHGAFQGLGDECLDLLRCESRALGEDGDGGFGHVWQDLDGKV